MGYRRAAVSAGLLVASVAVIAAGCSSTKSRISPRPGLRGVAVSNFECPPRPTSSARNPVRIVGVQAMLLCPLRAPGPASRAVTISKGQPQFAKLLAALSVPDESPTTGACEAYADLPQFVLAKTARGVYEVAIPVDACQHYQRSALEALNHARGA